MLKILKDNIDYVVFIFYVCKYSNADLLNRILLILAFFHVTIHLTATTIADSKKCELSVLDTLVSSKERADSIMRQVISNAGIYEKSLSRYEADIYIKGRTEILKSNALIHFAHHLIPIDRKNKDMLFEILSNSQYQAPNIYKHDIKAITGNQIPSNKKQQEALDFLNINAYSPTLYKDNLLTPISSNAFAYYHFSFDGQEEQEDATIYKIGFAPKQESQKLAHGTLYIIDKKWTIDRLDLNGRYSFADLSLQISFNRDEKKIILPENMRMRFRVNLLGNVIITSYESAFTYKMVEWREPANGKPARKPLDLTNLYSLAKKEIPIIHDTSFWNNFRNKPLTMKENLLYNKTEARQVNDSTLAARYWEITENLTGSINMDVKSTQVRYSGLLNPFQLGYSKMNGITYRQKVRLRKIFQNGQQLRFNPELGYIFKRKEIFLKLPGEFEYLPKKLGYFRFVIGNTYQSYPSEFMKEIKEQANDSTFNFSSLNLPYFKTYFADIRNNIEIINGLQAQIGFSYYYRTPSEKKNLPGDNDINELVNEDYTDFTPVVNLSYTPRQYYRMVGGKKEYMYSYYPTISVELAQAIPGVLSSNGDFSRLEANIQQKITFALCRNLSYNISGGLYTKQKSIYFADFRFFGQSYFPDRWSEEIGGRFHLLNREWYNASDKYAQAHFMYESPFLLLHLFKKGASKYVLSERLYFGQLWTPVLSSYTEVGYGIGNHLFNIAAFASFKKGEQQSFGLKFAFELF